MEPYPSRHEAEELAEGMRYTVGMRVWSVEIMIGLGNKSRIASAACVIISIVGCISFVSLF